MHVPDNAVGAKLKLRELFTQWLNLDTTPSLLRKSIKDALASTADELSSSNSSTLSLTKMPVLNLSIVANHTRNNNIKRNNNSSNNSNDDDKSIPPLSPPSSCHFVKKNTLTASPHKEKIPRFYFPNKTPGESNNTAARAAIKERFGNNTQTALSTEAFVEITKDIFNFPSFFNAPVIKKIGSTTFDSVMKFWITEMEPFDATERFFRLLKSSTDKDYLTKEDFAPYLHELLLYHPGLDFLSGTPEFQEKYALTVIVRIFYTINRDGSGRISLRELRKSNLLQVFDLVDEEEDINKIHAYFSYEHFYVLYCKFWELDSDHDFLISRDDLVRYGGHCLTTVIVDRVFTNAARPFGRIQSLSNTEREVLTYEDFIYFMLSEEDKGNVVSLSYWFEVVDFNQDGVIRADEMRYFYNEQMDRMESLGHEVVPFEDVFCQLSDLICPATEGEFVLADFTKKDKIRISGVFFNVLFNLSKFIAFESRDPFMMRQMMAEPDLTDWDRYARSEYARLAMEEEGREEDVVNMMEDDDHVLLPEDRMEVDDDNNNNGKGFDMMMSNDDSVIKKINGYSNSSKGAEAPF